MMHMALYEVYVAAKFVLIGYIVLVAPITIVLVPMSHFAPHTLAQV